MVEFSIDGLWNTLVMRRQSILSRQALKGADADGVDHRSISTVVACSIITSVLATVFVLLRISIRRSRGHLALDDWLIVACLPFMYAVTIVALIAVYRGGVGRSLASNLASNPHSTTISFQSLLALEITYNNLITLIKLSVLATYRLIFPTALVQYGTLVLGAMSFMWWLAAMLVTLFQCRPLSGMWDPPTSHAECLDRSGLFLGNTIPHIAIDILILALPLYEVAKLQMTRAKKLGLLAIFMLGGATTIVGGLRLHSGIVVLADNGGDITLAVSPLWAWSVVEPGLGIACACLPTVGGRVVAWLVTVITTPKPSQHAESCTKKTIRTGTIGGSGSARGGNRPAFSGNASGDATGSFEQLEDEASDGLPTDLWPKGYRGFRSTTVSGRRTPSEQIDEIPLRSITVRHEVSWAESRADTQ